MCWSSMVFNSEIWSFISSIERWALLIILIICPVLPSIQNIFFERKNSSGSNYVLDFLFMEFYFIFCLSLFRVVYIIYEFIRCADISKVTLCTLRILCYSGDFQGIAYICSQIDVLAILGSALGILFFLMYVKVKFGGYMISS